MEKKMTNEERAKQFLPFASLRGFYTLVRNKEKIITPRKILENDELEKLSYLFKQLKKGKIVTITYYENDGYITFQGIITKIDEINKKLTIVTSEIKVEDIIKIEAEWLKEF